MSVVLDPIINDEDTDHGSACHFIKVATGETLCGTVPKKRRRHSPEECEELGHQTCVVCEDLWAHILKRGRF